MLLTFNQHLNEHLFCVGFHELLWHFQNPLNGPFVKFLEDTHFQKEQIIIIILYFLYELPLLLELRLNNTSTGFPPPPVLRDSPRVICIKRWYVDSYRQNHILMLIISCFQVFLLANRDALTVTRKVLKSIHKSNKIKLKDKLERRKKTWLYKVSN